MMLFFIDDGVGGCHVFLVCIDGVTCALMWFVLACGVSFFFLLAFPMKESSVLLGFMTGCFAVGSTIVTVMPVLACLGLPGGE